MDVLRIPLNCHRWVKEIRNIGRLCKTLLLSYLMQILLNIKFYWRNSGKINEAQQILTQHLIRNKEGNHVMLNLRRESQGHTHSFKLSRKNIKHRPLTLWWRIALDFQCKRVRNGYIKILSTIFWKHGSCDTEYSHMTKGVETGLVVTYCINTELYKSFLFRGYPLLKGISWQDCSFVCQN